MSKASTIYHQKHYINEDLVLEAKIYTVEDLESEVPQKAWTIIGVIG